MRSQARRPIVWPAFVGTPLLPWRHGSYGQSPYMSDAPRVAKRPKQGFNRGYQLRPPRPRRPPPRRPSPGRATAAPPEAQPAAPSEALPWCRRNRPPRLRRSPERSDPSSSRRRAARRSPSPTTPATSIAPSSAAGSGCGSTRPTTSTAPIAANTSIPNAAASAIPRIVLPRRNLTDPATGSPSSIQIGTAVGIRSPGARPPAYHSQESWCPPGFKFPGDPRIDYQMVAPYLEYAPNAKNSFFIEMPARFLNPTLGQESYGWSDMNLGFKHAFVANPNQFYTFQFRTYVPTGSGERGLGTNHREPGAGTPGVPAALGAALLQRRVPRLDPGPRHQFRGEHPQLRGGAHVQRRPDPALPRRPSQRVRRLDAPEREGIRPDPMRRPRVLPRKTSPARRSSTTRSACGSAWATTARLAAAAASTTVIASMSATVTPSRAITGIKTCFA